jgi:uncharacterized protein YyaL (SSP411 family)
MLDKPASAQTTAWLCRDMRCLPPITDLDELLEFILPEKDGMTGY